MSESGAPKLDPQPVQVVEIVIQWAPQNGQLRVMWPNVDDVAKLGLLEMAKLTLIEMRAQKAAGAPSGLVIPAGRLPH